MTINQSFSISYSLDGGSTTGASAGWWMHLEQEDLKDDVALIEEAAELIDALFDLDPCAGTGLTGGEELTEPPVTEEEFDEIVSDVVTISTCDLVENGYTVWFRIYLSDPGFPYDYTVLEGSSGGSPQTVQEVVSETITLEGVSSYTLTKPVLGAITIEPGTNLYTSGGIPETINIVYESGVISFGATVTGVINVSFNTQYTRVPVQLPLNEEETAPISGHVRVEYHGLIEELSLEPPEIDVSVTDEFCGEGGYGGVRFPDDDPDSSCTERRTQDNICQCSGDIRDSEEVTIPITCPDWADPGAELYNAQHYEVYVDCFETEDVHTLDFYKQTCCYDKPDDIGLPLCEEVTSVFVGGEPIEHGKDYWINRYAPDKVIFIGLVPEDNDGFCGERVVRQIIPDNDCCGPLLPDLEWTQTQDTIEWNESAVFCVTGGSEPYTWQSSSQGIVITGSGACRRLEANNCFCDPIIITVTDACNNQITTEVTSTEGYWDAIDISEVPTILESEYVPGGCNVGSQFSATGQTSKYKVIQGFTCVSNMSTEDGACNYSSVSLPQLPRYINLDISGTDYYECPDSDAYVRPHPSNPTNFDAFLPGTANAYKWVCPGMEDELVYDDETSPETIIDNNVGVVYWDGGKAPFNISVGGQELWLDNGHTITQSSTSNRQHYIYTGNACGVLTVSITDSCGNSVQGIILSTSGEWQQDYSAAGGIYGHLEGDEGYPGGCPFTSEVGAGVYDLIEATQDGFKIDQWFFYYCWLYGAYSTYQDAIAACEARTCVWDTPGDPNYYPGRYKGSCFTTPDSCRECGDCSESNYPAAGVNLGKHSNVTTTYWYGAYTRWNHVQQTRILKWIC